MEGFLNLFSAYGVIIIFVLIALEHMNLPGLPAGILMPGVGVLAARGSISLIESLFICLIAGLVGSIILYGIGYFGGARLLDKISAKYPSFNRSLEKVKERANRDKGFSKITCRFIPVVRTLISIVEGGMKVKFSKFIVASSIGIMLYNSAFILSGYLLTLGVV